MKKVDEDDDDDKSLKKAEIEMVRKDSNKSDKDEDDPGKHTKM